MNEQALLDEIKELKKQVKTLTVHKSRYQKLFEVSADALSILDLETGKFVECNQAAIDMHGMDTEENFLNATPADLSPEYQPCGTKSADLAMEKIQKTFAEGPQVFEWLHLKPNTNELFPCLVSLTPLVIDDIKYLLAVGRDISDIAEAQELLEQERRKFEKFVNLAPVGIAINKYDNGQFTYINEEFAKFTGYSVHELNTMDYWDLTPKKYSDQEQIQLQNMNTTGRYGPYQKEYIHKDGHTYPVLLSGVKIRDLDGEEYIWSVVEDISDRVNTLNELNNAKDEADLSTLRLHLANRSAGIGVWDLEIQSGELTWDDHMYRLYGITADQFSGVYEAWVNGVHPDDIDYASDLLKRAIDGKAVYDPEFRVVWPDGTVKTLKAFAEVVRDEDGTPTRMIGVNYDITEKVKTIHELELARKQALASAKAKEDFLSNMSHEIRTPMNGVYGTLQLLNQQKQSKEGQQLLDSALFSAKSLLTIVNDILDFSKIEAGKIQLDNAEFNLVRLAESVVSDFYPTAVDKGLNLSCIIPKKMPKTWLGDPVRIKQVLTNLVSNAVKFTEEGSVTLTLKQQKDGIHFVVSDTGIGMSPDALSRIFDRFEQADKTTTRKYGGTGLGMSITTSLVDMMGGEVVVDSIENEGSKFTVTLPITVCEEKAVIPTTDKAYDVTSCPKIPGKKILVAEDNMVNMMIVSKMLKETEATIIKAGNGAEAIEMAQEHYPDLILMDIQMPVLDGINACEVIRKTDFDKPIISFTANALSHEVEKYLSGGFDGHLSKPIEIENLYDILRTHLVKCENCKDKPCQNDK